MTQHGIELQSPGPLANTLPCRLCESVEKIICTVVKLILSDIRSTILENDFYSFEDEIDDILTFESF